MTPLSILVLTLDEVDNLRGCLESVSWADDVWVLDSHSTDGTQELARALGANVVERPFDDWSSHQNWALEHLDFAHEWVLYLDADERVSPELGASIRAAVAAPGDHAAFRMRRLDHMFGGPIPHAQMLPVYARLFRHRRMRYIGLAHPANVVDGPIGDLDGVLVHHPMSKGLMQWLSKHLDYADLEARQQRDVTLGSGATLRARVKYLFRRLPGRPILRFLYLYVGRRGFLDGRAGFRVSVLQGWYEYVIALRAEELEGWDRR